ncbi:unnamed protein product [Bursaphelenchus xylophilus]|uniref:(pine wood nematode) hypothetical protein n=1 Tax=Bursaphelenchus xylophilus TaxID=6326 RepID=A0A1I7RLE7_BURXY|nr:unnamed protein product [Bursaphelenchus xylophilus]CAG9083074.1 unnamed protein product [Bursaphelenchus xylophilus]
MSRRSSNLALFTGQFGLSLMQVLFMFYYVKVFLNVFHVNEYWFNIAQLLFLIWNAINDPLFGYIQDLSKGWMNNRAKIFTYFGPLMSLSFLILWFPWRKTSTSPPYIEGVHLIIALFLYDAFYSCVGLAWGALFAESTRDHRRRVQGLKYSQLAILCSVNIIMITEKASHSMDNFAVFQTICVVVAALTMLCFFLTGRLSSSNKTKDRETLLEEDEDNVVMGWRQVLNLTGELLKARDFQRIVFTNFVHTIRSVAHLNFASIATDLLIPQRILTKGSWQISIFFAVCTLVPQLLVVLNETLMVRLGVYRIMMLSFIFSILSSFMYTISWSSYVIMFFMLIDSIMVHSIAPLFNILLAEFIEDDTARNARKSRMSSLIFSLNAFVMKPATSIAPVIVVYFLNRNGYELYQKEKIRGEELSRCMLRIIFCIPAVLASLQCLIFKSYSLRNKHMLPALPV